MNYSKYKMSLKELAFTFLIYISMAYLVAVLFYDNSKVAIVIMLGLPIFCNITKRKLIKKRENELKKQFCEMISAVSTALSAGLSMENAFEESLSDMISLFGRDSIIVEELNSFLQKIKVNISIDYIMVDFADRSGIEEIKDFSIVITETMKCGGSIPNVISKTVSMMKQKMEMENEIKVILDGKLLEQKIMCVVPFFIILYLRSSSGDFMNALYHNTRGVVVMTVCLLIYALSICLSSRITKIEV